MLLSLSAFKTLVPKLSVKPGAKFGGAGIHSEPCESSGRTLLFLFILNLFPSPVSTKIISVDFSFRLTDFIAFFLCIL